MKLSSLEKKFEKNKKPMRKFIKHLEESDVSDIIDIAHATEKEVWQEVDCLQCANCCKKMTPTLEKKDKQRIAEHLGMSVKDFKAKYLMYDEEEKDWRMQQQPCVFLDLNTNICNIYEVRPDDCRGFPHLVKLPMESYAYIHKQNIKYCPATFLWVEKMMERVEITKKKK